MLVLARRDATAARRFFHRALCTLKVKPSEVVTDAAATYPAVLDELIPQAWHHVEAHANNPIEADHSQLKHRLRAMRGLGTDRTAQVVIAGHAFMPNLRRGRYELGPDAQPALRIAAESVKIFWTLSCQSFCNWVGSLGGLIQATVGSLGGSGRRLNRSGLRA